MMQRLYSAKRHIQEVRCPAEKQKERRSITSASLIHLNASYFFGASAGFSAGFSASAFFSFFTFFFFFVSFFALSASAGLASFLSALTASDFLPLQPLWAGFCSTFLSALPASDFLPPQPLWPGFCSVPPAPGFAPQPEAAVAGATVTLVRRPAMLRPARILFICLLSMMCSSAEK